MEDGAHPPMPVEETGAASTPPPPPDPNLDDANAATTHDDATAAKSDEPRILDSEDWDITTISALGALRMLIDALTTLADTTGDIPPTPPASMPPTPTRLLARPNPPSPARRSPAHSRTPSRTASSTSVPTLVPAVNIGSPEAHPMEPLTVTRDLDLTVQQLALARRFFSKTAPPFTLAAYLTRLHAFCPHSPGVYLAAAAYAHRLCGASGSVVPATARTVHRVALSVVRVAAKTLEDNKWAQDRVAKVGGVTLRQLLSLEVTVCYLLDFELGVDAQALARGMFALQQAARRGRADSAVGGGFRLRLPLGKKRIQQEGT